MSYLTPNIPKKKYFVTGATGYLGSNLVKRLLEFDIQIDCLKRSGSDISRLDSVNGCINWIDVEGLDFVKYFEAANIDAIVHCATHYGRREIDPMATIDANLILPLKVLHAACRNNIRVFINTDTILDKRVNHYSLSKSQFLDWLKSYSSQISCFNLALEHFYGPGDDPTKFVTHLIHSLLRKESSLDFTEGFQKRDFIYIDDVIDAFMLIIDQSFKTDKGFFKYEIGSGAPIQIRQFISLVKSICKNDVTSLNFGVVPYRDNEVMLSKVDSRSLISLGWQPKVNLVDGLTKTIEVERYEK